MNMNFNLNKKFFFFLFFYLNRILHEDFQLESMLNRIDSYERLFDIYLQINVYQNHRDLLKMEVWHRKMNLLLDIQYEVDEVSIENLKFIF